MAAGDANINSSSSDLIIIIPASDNVHGSVGFSPTSSSSNEDVDSIDITILRSGGLEGDLLINFTVSDGGAVSPSDYQINSSCESITDTLFYQQHIFCVCALHKKLPFIDTCTCTVCL